MPPRAIKKWVYPLFGALLIAGAVALVRDTYYQGQDFDVYWRAARAFLDHQDFYGVGRDSGMVFKYPPWILPFFIPFAWVSLASAKLVWGLLQVFFLFGVCCRILSLGARAHVLSLALLGFWGIWAVHAMDGQVMLAVLFFAMSPRFPVRVIALSSKVFTGYALLGGNKPSLKELIAALALLITLSGVAARFSPSQGVAQFQAWVHAASSGDESLSEGKTRGRDNQGFPALITRSSSEKGFEIKVALALMLLFLPLIFVGRPIASDRLAIALGLAACVHPLAWFHLFVLAFPLAVLALDRSLKRPFGFVPALVGYACLALVTRKTFGSFGESLELLSIKSWGVLLLAVALRGASRASGIARSSTESAVAP